MEYSKGEYPCTNDLLFGLDWSFLQIKTKSVSSHKADSKQAKQEVTGTTILPPLVYPGVSKE
jgi:hypothetical protein